MNISNILNECVAFDMSYLRILLLFIYHFFVAFFQFLCNFLILGILFSFNENIHTDYVLQYVGSQNFIELDFDILEFIGVTHHSPLVNNFSCD